MGKSTISMTIFNSFLYVYWRVTCHQVAAVPPGHGGARAPALISPGNQRGAADGQDQQIATGECGTNDAGRLCLLL